MSDSMKCPFCGAELKECFVGMTYLTCTNIGCDFASLPLFPKVWQALISGKKAQRQLRTVKDRCVKKIKAKEFEIHNCLYGIHVRDCEIETLQEKLRQAQDALKVAIDALSKIDTFDCHGKGAIEIMAGMVSIANSALYEITSITKRE